MLCLRIQHDVEVEAQNRIACIKAGKGSKTQTPKTHRVKPKNAKIVKKIQIGVTGTTDEKKMAKTNKFN